MQLHRISFLLLGHFAPPFSRIERCVTIAFRPARFYNSLCEHCPQNCAKHWSWFLCNGAVVCVQLVVLFQYSFPTTWFRLNDVINFNPFLPFPVYHSKVESFIHYQGLWYSTSGTSDLASGDGGTGGGCWKKEDSKWLQEAEKCVRICSGKSVRIGFMIGKSILDPRSCVRCCVFIDFEMKWGHGVLGKWWEKQCILLTPTSHLK